MGLYEVSLSMSLLDFGMETSRHHIVTHGFVNKSRWRDCTGGQIDGEAGGWNTSGKIGLPPLVRVIGVHGQQQQIH